MRAVAPSPKVESRLHPRLEPKPHPALERATPSVRTSAAAADTVLIPPSLPLYARPREGQPLEGATRQKFEGQFRRDFSAVRLHFGASDKISPLSPNAQAVTVGNDIYLKQSTPAVTTETELLLVHELTHVAQQAAGSGATATPGDRAHDPLEHEAQRNVASFRQGRAPTVSQAAPLQPQAEEEQDHGWFYKVVVRAVPSLKPILDRGILGWIGDRVSEVASNIMEAIRGPLDTIRGIETSIATHIVKLVDWVKKCVAALAKGDCSVLHDGIDYIEQVIDGLTAPAFEMLKSAFEKVSKFFNGLWERFGAPLWTKIKEYAGAAWQKIEQFFGWVREKIQPQIDLVILGWNKVKTWLGIGDDPDSQNGLLPWAERKLEALWEKIKVKLEPIKKPLLVVAGILVMLSPAGPIIAIGLAIGGVIEGIRWIRRTFAVPNGVVSARDLLQKVILPKMIAAITGLALALAEKAGFILSKLLLVKQNLDDAATAVGDSLVSFLAGPIRFVSGLFASLVSWANDKLNDFVTWVSSVAHKLAGFLTGILDFLDDVAHTIRDILRIVYLLAGKVWNKVPACIRDPFIDFLGQQILGRIAIFQAIAGTPEAWAQTKNEVKVIIHTIFVDFDLIGAMKKVFRLLLRVLNVPLELLTAVLEKMGAAWDTIKEKPAEFLKNLFKTAVLALKGFFRRILVHLGHGIVGWLTAQLQGTSVKLPSDWADLGQIFSFVASVLGLSINHVCELLEKRGLTTLAATVRAGAKLVSQAWDWIELIIKGDFDGFWKKIKEQLTNLKEMIIQGVVDWVMEEVVESIMAQLVTTADPTGISETIMLLVDIYRTIKTVVQYMRQVLEMVQKMLDSILNIAGGVLQPAADLIEEAMDRGMPVVIGFLVNLAGFSNAGEKIKGVIKNIRDKVDNAILWLIDKAKGAFEAIKGAVGAVRDWWRERFSTKVGDESHTLTAHGEGAAAEIYIETTPKKLADFLSDLEANPKANKPVVGQIRAKLRDIARLKEGSMGQQAGRDIADDMADIADLLKTVLPGGVSLPESTVVEEETETVRGCTVGKHVKIEPLSYKPPADGRWRGSEPGYGNTFFRAVNRRIYTYVQGHLLNHNLYGPGQELNLVPIHRQLNTQMSSDCEEEVKKRVLSQNKVVSYDVKVTFGSWPTQYTHIPEENDLPTSITLRAYEMEKKSNRDGDKADDWKVNKSAVIYSNTLRNSRGPDEEPAGARHLKRVNLNSKAQDAEKAFQEVYGIGPAKASILYGKSRYSSLQDLADDLKLPDDSLNRWNRADHPDVALTGNIEWQ
jgi:phage-related protein